MGAATAEAPMEAGGMGAAPADELVQAAETVATATAVAARAQAAVATVVEAEAAAAAVAAVFGAP